MIYYRRRRHHGWDSITSLSISLSKIQWTTIWVYSVMKGQTERHFRENEYVHVNKVRWDTRPFHVISPCKKTTKVGAKRQVFTAQCDWLNICIAKSPGAKRRYLIHCGIFAVKTTIYIEYSLIGSICILIKVCTSIKYSLSTLPGVVNLKIWRFA